MRNSKVKSFVKKVTSIIDKGMEGILEGKENFENPKIEVESLAEARAMTCFSCVNFKQEPIEMFRVIDVRIPELSEMFCDDCGCELPYKLRQSKSKCKLWEQ